ncbi:hypothetical protein [Ruminococcus sp. Marseille-P6503]|uniref:hypothetical protein n=1 Tax=Ruminococcus sp. Marseille-P6503 TaxID=2364796 RepID=UPI000F53AE02|nr:hypothetical protein [Ruminococcus sp. Marseille-P6503]
MKKSIVFLFFFIFCISLCACENNDNKQILVSSTKISDNSSVTSEYIPDLPFEMSFQNGDKLIITDGSDSGSELKKYKVSITFNEDNVEDNVDFLIDTIKSVADTYKAEIADFSCYDSQNNYICAFTTLNYGEEPHISDISDGVWFDENYKAVFYARFK